MADLFPNPVGLAGFEFVEFAGPDPAALDRTFRTLGFAPLARHRSKQVTLYRQGGINFLLNAEPRSHAAFFAQEHGASACAMAFRVRDAHRAYQALLDAGAQPVDVPTGIMELRLPAFRGIGGALLYLIDRYQDGASVYDIDFVFEPGVERHPRGCGLATIDHLTHNVYRGRLDYWAQYYERLFGFREIRTFDIKGEYTGLFSRAMTAPDGLIRIPLNEESARGGGQIQEFLERYNGEGIQHIALHTDDICATVDALRANGVPMMAAPPATYYQMLEERLPGHGQPTAALAERGILLDGQTRDGPPRLLLQIFSECLIGPLFFEIIQRKADEGFGEGNFKALFESMERDQLRRGVLKDASAA